MILCIGRRCFNGSDVDCAVFSSAYDRKIQTSDRKFELPSDCVLVDNNYDIGPAVGKSCVRLEFGGDLT